MVWNVDQSSPDHPRSARSTTEENIGKLECDQQAEVQPGQMREENIRDNPHDRKWPKSIRDGHIRECR